MSQMNHFLGYQIALWGIVRGTYPAKTRDCGYYRVEILHLGAEQLLTKLGPWILIKHIEKLALEIGNRLYGLRGRQALGREFNTAEIGINSG
ncbi:MAG: hypothetical protein ACXW27_00150 [Allosphingosinicella sp.]